MSVTLSAKSGFGRNGLRQEAVEPTICFLSTTIQTFIVLQLATQDVKDIA